MNFLAPGMLLFGLLAVPIFLLYMLRLRRQDKLVSSTYLWQQLLKDQQANAPWQRLKYHILLIIQLLLLTALILALIRPAIPIQTLVSGPTVLVLDASASMNASDVAPSRFDAAKASAVNIINGLPNGTPVSIILAGVEPRLLSANETDHTQLSQALAETHADQGEADWKGAFTLAAGIAERPDQSGEIHTTTIIFSDGGLPQEGLPKLAGEVRYVALGKDSENIGITNLAVRQANDGIQLFSSIHNYGTKPHQFIFSSFGDDKLLDSRQINLAAGGSQDVLLSKLAAGARRYSVRLSSLAGGLEAVDSFSLDNSANTIYQSASGGKTLIISKGNVFLQQLFENLPGVQPYLMLTDNNQTETPTGEAYDILVLDGIIPANLPAGNLLMINPPENAYFKTDGTFSETGNVQVSDNAINRYLQWDNIHVLKAVKTIPPSWAETLIQAKGGPLLFAGENNGRRIAVLTFDLHDSDLPLQVTYPILFSNLVQYLTGHKNISVINNLDANQVSLSADVVKETNMELQPGESVQISPNSEVKNIQLTLPDGSTQTLPLTDGKVVFNQTREVGVYSVVYPGHTDMGSDYFAVNLFSAEESQIAPKSTLPAGQNTISNPMETVAGQLDLWPWFAGLALIVLIFEWWFFHRLQKAPHPSRTKNESR